MSFDSRVRSRVPCAGLLARNSSLHYCDLVRPENQKEELRDARVVIIGGGIAGSSAAYHLSVLGVTDVLLLERAALSSGTTWHSTGSMETYRDNPLIFDMVRYTVDSLPILQAESGQHLGWRNLGRVMYTDSESRFEVFKTLPELGSVRGIEIELLSKRGVGERLPIIDPEGLIGGVWIPSDGCVNPTDVVTAYAKAARRRGARICEHVRVVEIVVKNGRVQGVVTDHGVIGCDTVVVAAGRWSSAITEPCGIRLPLYALEHQYIVTEAIPGLNRNLPLILSYDDQLYGREEVGGLILGSFDDDAIPVASPNTAAEGAFVLLNERWDQFEPYMKTALRRFPVLNRTGIKTLVNGPESFTPDGEMLLGPIAGVDGLYSMCGFCSNGIALSPAAGKFTAEWIVEGQASTDVSQIDVRRFTAHQGTEEYLRRRVTEVPRYACRMHESTDDYETARPLRLSPIHAQLAGAGAQFGSIGAWERPLWIQNGRLSHWTLAVAEEVSAAHQSALLIDRSSDVKISLVGVHAGAWSAAKLGIPGLAERGSVETAAFPGERRRVEAFARVIPWPDGVLIAANPEQETRVIEWIRRAQLPSDIHAIDLTAGLALFELFGPARREVLRALADDLDSGSLGWAGAARVTVFEDSLNASTLICPTADTASYTWQRLLAVGAASQIRIGGHLAGEAWRIARGIPSLGREASPAIRVEQVVGNRQFADMSAPDAASPPRRSRTLAAFWSAPLDSCFGSHDVILQRGQIVGQITSRVSLPGSSETLSIGLLSETCESFASLEFLASGRRWPLSQRSTPWQPNGPMR